MRWNELEKDTRKGYQKIQVISRLMDSIRKQTNRTRLTNEGRNKRISNGKKLSGCRKNKSLILYFQYQLHRRLSKPNKLKTTYNDWHAVTDLNFYLLFGCGTISTKHPLQRQMITHNSKIRGETVRHINQSSPPGTPEEVLGLKMSLSF